MSSNFANCTFMFILAVLTFFQFSGPVNWISKTRNILSRRGRLRIGSWAAPLARRRRAAGGPRRSWARSGIGVPQGLRLGPSRPHQSQRTPLAPGPPSPRPPPPREHQASLGIRGQHQVSLSTVRFVVHSWQSLTKLTTMQALVTIYLATCQST